MKGSNKQKPKFKIASDNKTPSEIYSIILRGVTSTFRSIMKNYFVSENIEALMKYINERNILSSDEYKRLLNEAKDFYTVIICALFINPIKAHSNNFKVKEIKKEVKDELFKILFAELREFFIDWLCEIDIDPLLYYRLGISYNKQFDVNMYIKSKLSYDLIPIESQILKEQTIEIIINYLIEQVGIHLGLAGLDYIDYDRLYSDKADAFVKVPMNDVTISSSKSLIQS